MKEISIKNIILVVFGAIGGFFTHIFGTWTHDLSTLIFFMLADYFLGLTLAAVFHKSTKSDNGSLNSTAGLKGIAKKVGLLVLVAIGYRLDLLMAVNYIRTGTIIALIVNELLSIIENLGLMGVPMPAIINEAIDLLKKKSDGGFKE